MACELPVMAMACSSGLREIIINDVDSGPVQKDDVDVLTDTLYRLMSDQTARLRLGISAKSIVDRFNLKRCGGDVGIPPRRPV